MITFKIQSSWEPKGEPFIDKVYLLVKPLILKLVVKNFLIVNRLFFCVSKFQYRDKVFFPDTFDSDFEDTQFCMKGY